jgi:hypothetical protein
LLLRSAQRSQVRAARWRATEIAEYTIQHRQRQLGRRRDLDSKRPTVRSQIDDQAGFNSARPNRTLPRRALKVEVRSKRLAVTIRDFEICFFHASKG